MCWIKQRRYPNVVQSVCVCVCVCVCVGGGGGGGGGGVSSCELHANYSLHVRRVIVWDIKTAKALSSYRGELIDFPGSYFSIQHSKFVV